MNKQIKPILIFEKLQYQRLIKFLPKSYQNIDEKKAKKLNEMLVEELTKIYPNLYLLTQRIVKELDIPLHIADRIVRTESNFIMNLKKILNELTEDVEGTRRYIWFGPDDNRTTPICKEIKRRTARGVKLNELRRIIIEVSKKYLPEFDTRNGTIAHYNCRHTILRVR